MFTILFPIRIVVSALSNFSVIFNALSALLLPFAASCLRRILFTEENAVSIAEKQADIIINRTIAKYFTDIFLSEYLYAETYFSAEYMFIIIAHLFKKIKLNYGNFLIL